MAEGFYRPSTVGEGLLSGLGTRVLQNCCSSSSLTLHSLGQLFSKCLKLQGQAPWLYFFAERCQLYVLVCGPLMVSVELKPTDPCPKYRGIQGLLQIKLQIKIKSLSRFTLSPGDSQFHIISEAFSTCH